MQPKIIRVIAQLPPKGSVAAQHAGAVIFHLLKAGHDLRPATTVGPAYSPETLPFAPKRAYAPTKARLLAEAADTLLLYPEGLDFRVISQARWRHRRLEEWRRIVLVWQLLRRSKRSVVVWRPKQLKRPDHLIMVAMAAALKPVFPRRITLIRQSRGAAKLAEIISGQRAGPCPPDQADLASLQLAMRHGGKGDTLLTPVWLRAALAGLRRADPLHSKIAVEIALIEAVISAFGEEALPLFQAPDEQISVPPFADSITEKTHGAALSRFMLHFHHARRLQERFALDSPESAAAYRRWYLDEAADIVGHALPLAEKLPLKDPEIAAKPLAAALHRLVARARYFGAESGIGPGLHAWLNQPLTPHPDALTRLELLVAVLAHAPVSDAKDLQKPWQSPALKRWFADLARRGYPLLAAIAGVSAPVGAAAYRVTGSPGSDTGLGQNRAMSVRALRGITPKRDFFLHHVNADAIPAQMFRHHRPGAFHIGYLLWEIEQLPAAHHLAGEVLDEIWVPTRYLERIYTRAYDRPVTRIGKGFDLPAPEKFDLGTLGIAPNQPVFLLSFDLHSSVARKNPLAAVLAFQIAFAGRPEVRLIIKTSVPPKDHWGDPERQMSIIAKIIAKDRRIVLLQQHLPFARYLGLIKAATALVSSHRAEGFGYVPAYAMKLGTPVIVTDYSGTQDFCTPKTALTVPWRARNVRPGEPIFPLEGAIWAEIDHNALAGAMRDVLANPEAAKARSRAGQALMARDYSSAALRQRYLDTLGRLGLI